MSLFEDFKPPRLHKQTWAEAHRFEILVSLGVIAVLVLFFIALLTIPATVVNTI